MKHRDPILVVLFSLITFGISGLVWFVQTKNEMNKKGANIPTAWLLVIPLIEYIWFWKFSEGVEGVTNRRMGAGTAFLLLVLLGVIGMAIIQAEFNKVKGPSI